MMVLACTVCLLLIFAWHRVAYGREMYAHVQNENSDGNISKRTAEQTRASGEEQCSRVSRVSRVSVCHSVISDSEQRHI